MRRLLQLSILLLFVATSARAATLPAEAPVPGSPMIESFTVSDPVFPFKSHGDLWLSTWADNDDVYMSWGDGLGPNYENDNDFSHHGLAETTGALPNISSTVIQRFMPLSDDKNNSKPTSMLFVDHRLYIASHSPLLLPEIGFIDVSDDYGKTISHDLELKRTKQSNPNFVCLIFINMGKAYELNTDGYVYAFGTQGEINVSGNVYLARMPKDAILDETKWEYYTGLDARKQPLWSAKPSDSATIPGLSSQKYTGLFPNMLFSAAWHPGIQRYIVLTAATEEGKLYESPAPWGPWTLAGKWFSGRKSPWSASYMPGIITKDMGPDSFYFTAAGRLDLEPKPGDKMYALKIGKITMKLKK